MLVSFFSQLINPDPTESLNVLQLLEGIRDGRWAEQVRTVRALPPNGAAYNSAKKQLPCFTASGTFKRRTSAGLLEHSGLVALDLDASQKPGFDPRAARRLLMADPLTYACFASVGGQGLCVLVRIAADNHAGSFRGLRAYYKQAHDLVVDNLGDVSRLRFVSYDPALYLNEQAGTFGESLPAATNLGAAAPVLATDLFTSN